MLKRILTATATAVLLATPVYAQTANSPDKLEPTPLTPPADTMNAAPDKSMPSEGDALEGKQRVSGLTQGQIITKETSTQVRADSLIGRSVVNNRGEDLGKVEDIILDEDGRVAGLVVSTGGILGIGGKSVGVAWYDVGNTLYSKSIRLPLSRSQIEQAPPFEKSKLSPEAPQSSNQ